MEATASNRPTPPIPPTPNSTPASIEFLDRHPWLPIVLLVLLPFALCLPLLLAGRSLDPIWYTSGITKSSQILQGQPWIDPNVGFTSEALGRLSARDLLHGILPWWNPYSGVGMPLAGEMQPAAFFLPFTFLFLLPEGMLWQRVCMQLIAGLATYALLRELGLSRLASLMGGALFSMNCTLSWTPGPCAVYCALPFLPLTLWGIEKARTMVHGAFSILVIGAAILYSILAGFPEPAYISGLFVVAWGIYRLATDPERRARLAGRAIAGFLLGLMVTTPLLISFADYLQESDSFTVHKAGEEALPVAGFAQITMPYVFGPLPMDFHSRPLFELWGNTGGYAGILLVLLAALGASCREPDERSGQRGLKVLLAAWVLLAWAKGFGVQPVKGLFNFIPLLRQAAFYRYSPPSWFLALAILAAFGLDSFRQQSPGRRKAFGFTLAVLAVGIGVAWPQRAFWQRSHALLPIMFILLGISLAWALLCLLVTSTAWKRMHGERRRVVLASLLVFDAVVMFLAPQVSSMKPDGIDTAAMQFLRTHQGLSRSYALGALQPNFSAFYGFANIDHNVLPVPKLWAHYVDRHILPGLMAKFLGVDFTPIYFDEGVPERGLNRNLGSVLDLGVRYIITAPSQSPMPKVSVPASDYFQRPVYTFKESLFARFKFMARLGAWARSTENNAARPHFERSLAAAIARQAPAVVPGTTREDSADLSSDVNSDRLLLLPGQSVSITAPAMPKIPDGLPIRAVETVLGTFGKQGDGDLSIELCAGDGCRSGHRSLVEVEDLISYSVPLDAPLTPAANAPMRLTIARQGGSQPLTLWLRPGTVGQGQRVVAPRGPVEGKAVQLSFEYGADLPGLHKAYSDTYMEVWELANAAPYFEVVDGGPCTLHVDDSRREALAADCRAPATLLRREQFMRGWTASVNGQTTVPTLQHEIFQAYRLPAGHSDAHFAFVPPHMAIGWAASAIGLAGFLWQLVLLVRQRRIAAA